MPSPAAVPMYLDRPWPLPHRYRVVTREVAERYARRIARRRWCLCQWRRLP